MSCQKCGGEHSTMACDDEDEQRTSKVQSSLPASTGSGTAKQLCPLRLAIDERLKTEDELIRRAKRDNEDQEIVYHRGFKNALLWLLTDCEDKWPND